MRLIDLTGQTFGRVTVLGRADHDYLTPSGRRIALWDVACSCGQRTTITGANLRTGHTRSCGCYKAEVSSATGRLSTKKHPTYARAHHRIRAALGRAPQHPCVDCGQPAQGWSYQHDDPDELVETRALKSGRTHLLRYSTKPEHYAARCNSCHFTFDNQRRTAEVSA